MNAQFRNKHRLVIYVCVLILWAIDSQDMLQLRMSHSEYNLNISQIFACVDISIS